MEMGQRGRLRRALIMARRARGVVVLRRTAREKSHAPRVSAFVPWCIRLGHSTSIEGSLEAHSDKSHSILLFVAQ